MHSHHILFPCMKNRWSGTVLRGRLFALTNFGCKRLTRRVYISGKGVGETFDPGVTLATIIFYINSHMYRIVYGWIQNLYSKIRINPLPLGDLNEIIDKSFFKLILVIGGWCIFCVIAPGWSSPNLTDDESTSAQVMAWCHQVTSHYLNQCWPSSISLYGITRPQCVYQHIPQHHIPQHQYELKLDKMVAKITIASKVTPFNGSLYGLTSVRNCVAYIVCLFLVQRLYSIVQFL